MVDMKAQVVAMLSELTDLTVLDEGSAQSFRARAYENAMHEIQGLSGDITTMTKKDLMALPGIGKSTADKILSFIKTGEVEKLEKLRKKYPAEFLELSHIPGLGPKTLIRLRDELSIHNVSDLRSALKAKKIRTLKGLGAKVEENLIKSVERLGHHGKDKRTPIADALPIANHMVSQVLAIKGVEKAQYCGSLRRFRDTIADIDIVVAASKRDGIMNSFTELPDVAEVIGTGETKTSILTKGNLQVDLRIVSPNEFGAAILYFTGSKAHNIKIRQLAIQKGWTLNEYGLTDVETGKIVAQKTEKEIYAALDLPWIAPPLREDQGEVEADKKSLPKLQVTDIRGDLHMHSDISGDSSNKIKDIVSAAEKRGYEYIAITDHGPNLDTSGATKSAFSSTQKKIKALTPKSLKVLTGCELNIGPEGELDFDKNYRGSFDWCLASIHDHFDLPAEKQTKRIIKAMQDPSVRAIGHLTARRLGKREPLTIDVDAVFSEAERTNTAIEINLVLSRLDPPSDMLRMARNRDVLFVLNSDAHTIEDLNRPEIGINHALRGWVDKARVINTWPWKKFEEWLKA